MIAAGLVFDSLSLHTFLILIFVVFVSGTSGSFPVLMNVTTAFSSASTISVPVDNDLFTSSLFCFCCTAFTKSVSS